MRQALYSVGTGGLGVGSQWSGLGTVADCFGSVGSGEGSMEEMHLGWQTGTHCGTNGAAQQTAASTGVTHSQSLKH